MASRFFAWAKSPQARDYFFSTHFFGPLASEYEHCKNAFCDCVKEGVVRLERGAVRPSEIEEDR